MIPKDPVILLSYVNTQLRDYYESLEALCTCRGIKKKDLISQLDQIDVIEKDGTIQNLGEKYGKKGH